MYKVLTGYRSTLESEDFPQLALGFRLTFYR